MWVGFSLNTGKRFFLEVSFQMQQRKSISVYSTEVSNRSFYPIFNERLDHLETLLTICRTKNVLSAGSLCGLLVPSPQSKCPKRTFMLPQKYHASVWNMLSKPLKCFMENENEHKFQGPNLAQDPLQSAWSRALFYPISIMPQISTKDSGIF